VLAGPSRMDRIALQQLAGYTLKVGKEGAGLFFIEGPSTASIHVPPPLTAYSDTGYPGHVNGTAQDGRAIYIGEEGSLGAAFHSKSNKNIRRQGDSVPVDEARAALSAAKDGIQYYEMGLEVAGLQARIDHGHAQHLAARLCVGSSLMDAMQKDDDDDDILNTRANELAGTSSIHRPVSMYCDSQVVTNAVEARNLTKGMSNVRHNALIFSCLADWDKRHLIHMQKCTAEGQVADALTKVERGIVATTKQAIALTGCQPALEARLRRQLLRYPRAKSLEGLQGTDDKEQVQQEDLGRMMVDQVSTATQSSRGFVATACSIGRKLLDKMGFNGKGLGKLEQGIPEPLDGVKLAARQIGHQQQQEENGLRVDSDTEGVLHGFVRASNTVEEHDLQLARETKNNTEKNASQCSEQSIHTVCEQVEELIISSKILEWALSHASDAEEWRFIVESQDTALRTLEERRQAALVPVVGKRTLAEAGGVTVDNTSWKQQKGVGHGSGSFYDKNPLPESVYAETYDIVVFQPGALCYIYI